MRLGKDGVSWWKHRCCGQRVFLAFFHTRPTRLHLKDPLTLVPRRTSSMPSLAAFPITQNFSQFYSAVLLARMERLRCEKKACGGHSCHALHITTRRGILSWHVN